MPVYYFDLVDDDSIHADIYFQFKDAPRIGAVIEHEGKHWRRMPTYVQAASNTKCDHWNSKDFVEKTGRMKGNWGELESLSAEMSAKRAKDAGGEDPILATHEASREKLTGLKPFRKRKVEAKEKLAKMGVELN